MVEPRFDELIHPSSRLFIVALLAAVDWVDLAFVRDRLGLSDSALSEQFATLQDAGYIVIERSTTNRRRRVHGHVTDVGRRASDGHVAALRQFVAGIDQLGHGFAPCVRVPIRVYSRYATSAVRTLDT